MTDPRTIHAVLREIKAAVGAVGKDDVNQQQHFNFRGVDAVVNAVAPAFIEAGVSVVPNVRTFDYGTVEVGRNRTPMGHARVVVEYTLYGPEGDSITGSAPGEAMDSGDKATAKAMSVAYRTFLLQALSLPTTESDPDAVTFQRTDVGELQRAISEVQAAWLAAHPGDELDVNAIAQDYALRYRGADIRQASVEQLRAYLTQPLGEPPVPAPPVPGTQEQMDRATSTVPTSGQAVDA